MIFYIIKRSKDGKKKDGRWYVDNDGWEPGIYVTCPFCGKAHNISDHEISENGSVSPCVVCANDIYCSWKKNPKAGCGRYLHLHLDKWDLGYRRERTR